jgi:hypothetical protein
VDKELVVEVLSERADGMQVDYLNVHGGLFFSNLSSGFRRVFYHLETLRHCLPPSVQYMPGIPSMNYRSLCNLDETYGHTPKEIKKPNRAHSHHLLQCLVVAFRPLEWGNLQKSSQLILVTKNGYRS